MARVSVLIPAYNEAGRIGDTVRAALDVPGVIEVIVADDASADPTAEIARANGARVIRLKRNSGKGAALEAAAEALSDTDIVLLLDADLGDTAREATLLIEPVEAGDADMTIATFPPPTAKAGFGLVKSLARFGIRTLGSREFHAQAPLSGQRAMTAETISALRPFARGYGVELALTVRALRAGLRIQEVATSMSHAATSRDLAGFTHRGRQFVHVLGALARLALNPGPRRRY